MWRNKSIKEGQSGAGKKKPAQYLKREATEPKKPKEGRPKQKKTKQKKK